MSDLEIRLLLPRLSPLHSAARSWCGP